MLDLIFCSLELCSGFTKCYVSPDLRIPSANHLPVLSTVNIPTATTTASTCPNFKIVDWADFYAGLAHYLATQLLITLCDLDTFVKDLTAAIHLTINDHVPSPISLLMPNTGGCPSCLACNTCMPTLVVWSLGQGTPQAGWWPRPCIMMHAVTKHQYNYQLAQSLGFGVQGWYSVHLTRISMKIPVQSSEDYFSYRQ